MGSAKHRISWLCAVFLVGLLFSFISPRAQSGEVRRAIDAIGRARTEDPKLHEQVSRRVLVELKDKSGEKALLQRLTGSYRKIFEVDRFVLLESKYPVHEDDLTALTNMPEVQSAIRDRVMRVQSRHPIPQDSSAACDAPSTDPLDPRATQVLKSTIGKVAEPACELVKGCPDGSRSLLWAQQEIDADLMAKEFDRIGATLADVHVAVVDTGLDEVTGITEISAADIQFKPVGHDPKTEIAPANQDTYGHGTGVTALIAGINGIGISPGVNLSEYSIAPPGTLGETSEAVGRLSLLQACKDGNTIINLSASFHADSKAKENEATNGLGRDEKVMKSIISELETRGCIVVKAGGNDGNNQTFGSESLDSAYVRIAATRPGDAQEAGFSNEGALSAPGEDVYTLLGQKSVIALLQSGITGGNCGAREGAFLSGTSLSAPIVTAIDARIEAVLRKTNPRFSALSGPDRIRLINRIAKASEKGGTVNALRAVLIAEAWGSAPGSGIPAVSELAKLLSTAPAVRKRTAEVQSQTALQHCSEVKGSCPDKKACYDLNRWLSSVSNTSDEKRDTSLLNAALSSGSPELVGRWVRNLSPRKSLDVNAEDLEAFSKAPENSLDMLPRLRTFGQLARAGVVIPPAVQRNLLQGFERELTQAKAQVPQLTGGEANRLIKTAEASRAMGLLTPEWLNSWSTRAGLDDAAYAGILEGIALVGDPTKRSELFEALIGNSAKGSITRQLIANTLMINWSLGVNNQKLLARFLADPQLESEAIGALTDGLSGLAKDSAANQFKVISALLSHPQMNASALESLVSKMAETSLSETQRASLVGAFERRVAALTGMDEQAKAELLAKKIGFFQGLDEMSAGTKSLILETLDSPRASGEVTCNFAVNFLAGHAFTQDEKFKIVDKLVSSKKLWGEDIPPMGFTTIQHSGFTPTQRLQLYEKAVHSNFVNGASSFAKGIIEKDADLSSGDRSRLIAAIGDRVG